MPRAGGGHDDHPHVSVIGPACVFCDAIGVWSSTAAAVALAAAAAADAAADARGRVLFDDVIVCSIIAPVLGASICFIATICGYSC